MHNFLTLITTLKLFKNMVLFLEMHSETLRIWQLAGCPLSGGGLKLLHIWAVLTRLSELSKRKQNKKRTWICEGMVWWMGLEKSRKRNRSLENISFYMCIKFSKKKIKKKKMHHWKSKMALTFYIAVFFKRKNM